MTVVHAVRLTPTPAAAHTNPFSDLKVKKVVLV
jgi:hypothetical protein